MTASTLTKSKRSRLKSKRPLPPATVESPQPSHTHVPRVEAPDRGEALREGVEHSLARRAEAPDAGLARSSEYDSGSFGGGRSRN